MHGALTRVPAAADLEALAAARAAAVRSRALAHRCEAHSTHLAAHLAQCADALDHLVRCLRAAGEHQEALEVAQECCGVKRELAAWGERLRL